MVRLYRVQKTHLSTQQAWARVRGTYIARVCCVQAQGKGTKFEQRDVRQVQGVGRLLGAGDLLVALHPCGSLGDAVIEALVAGCGQTREGEEGVGGPAGSRCLSGRGAQLLLVSCCLAGRGGAEVPDPRPASSRAGAALGLELPRAALKKANLGMRRSRVLRGAGEARRKARLAMRLLLRGRGVHVPSGEEMLGLPKRSQSATSVAALLGVGADGGRMAQGVDGAVAAQALEKRGLSGLAEGEAERVVGATEDAWPAVVRLELVDVMLGDLVELAVNLDRACVLEEAGLYAGVGRLFDAEVSPRNLAIYASPLPLLPPGQTV